MKAAGQGHAFAQNNMGVCYFYGQGVEKSESKAVKLFEAAAGQGHSWAQNNLANCYFHGKGVEQNRAKAMEIYNKLAQEGNAEAKDRLERIKNNDFDWELGEAAAADIE